MVTLITSSPTQACGPASYLPEEDTNGEQSQTMHANLKAVINTYALGLLTCKTSCSQKQHPEHNTLLHPHHHSTALRCHLMVSANMVFWACCVVSLPSLTPDLPIRVNALCPSWMITAPGESHYKGVKVNLRGADAVARAAVLLMADESRHGQMVLSAANKAQRD